MSKQWIEEAKTAKDIARLDLMTFEKLDFIKGYLAAKEFDLELMKIKDKRIRELERQASRLEEEMDYLGRARAEEKELARMNIEVGKKYIIEPNEISIVLFAGDKLVIYKYHKSKEELCCTREYFSYTFKEYL